MFEAQGLTKDYGTFRALDGLTLTVTPGEIFCLLGANGAGKTTTINLFLNFLAPTSGIARIQGMDVTMHPQETKRLLAYIPENVLIYKNFTGLENLRHLSRLGGRTDYKESDYREFLRRAGLAAEAADRRVGSYSKGMRQKVAIALALAREARGLLLDEPTSGLDPKAAHDFSRLLQTLAESGVAILMATHDLFHAKATGSRVGIMKHGKLMSTLTTHDIGHLDLERIYIDHMND